MCISDNEEKKMRISIRHFTRLEKFSTASPMVAYISSCRVMVFLLFLPLNITHWQKNDAEFS